MRRLYRRRVVVTLKTGRTVAGVLVTARRGILELADAEIWGQGGPVDVDGRLFVDRVDVEFIQRPPGVSS